MSARGDGPIRLEDSHRLLSKEECESIWQRIKSFAQGGGEIAGMVQSWWSGELRWARNRVNLASDRRDIVVGVLRGTGFQGAVFTNQLDDASLQAAVRAAERSAHLFGGRDLTDIKLAPPAFDLPKPAIWSDATYNLSAESRGEVARAVIEPAEAQGLLSAGYLEMYAGATANFGDDRNSYVTLTQAQCSMTVRDQQGSGSGWAGLSGYDWTKIDSRALAERALQKALASRNPVALEPGRYTVILEPQAVHDLVSLLISALDRRTAELGLGPFTLGPDPALNIYRTKLGLKVVDERVTIDHDPMDPALGVVPYNDRDQGPNSPVKWIDHGVLTALWDSRDSALETRNENLPAANSFSFRMSGGATSVEEMIQTTKRGLLVTRFSNTRVLDGTSVLATGLTRDGLWLVENGKITKAVKNFRFTESPLFVLNSIEQMGVPVPVYRPFANPFGDDDPNNRFGLIPAIVPPLKARDFSFTSMIDAI